ncbi:MAG: cupin domain-containing protein, partial [Bdellovibrionaceae bacterium]|nr:cupin domain-containing protein [Pseudobdellovibrionaceae bacterium]
MERAYGRSRVRLSKAILRVFDGSFLGNTIRRLKALGEVHILTTKSMEALTHRAVKQENLDPRNVLFEPMGKNTAPAVALLCHILNLRGQGEEIVGVFPSDHLIADEAIFQRAVKLAEQTAKQGFVTTLGVLPSYPATGYGYIEVGSESLAREKDLKALQVKGFREKPNQATAKQYVDSGNYFWNAGMFVFRVSEMIGHFQKFQPAIWDKISQIDAEMKNARYNYAMVDGTSLDYGIMERLEAQACVPCDMGWSDVGSWDEMARLLDENAPLQSHSRAQVFNQNSENNYVFSVGSKVVGLVDVTDMLIVDTPDALLIARKGSSQKVKELVDAMKMANQPEATSHPFETRPWGGFEILADEKNHKTKRVTIDPGAQLSYQSHARRSEHWVVISGKGEVILNEKKISLSPGESIHIPVGAKHRMRNPGDTPLIFVEVQ